MCGIVGFFSFKKPFFTDADIQHMVLALKHRGPDEQNFWKDQDVYLGHSRLRVIDLSKEASQPMCNEDQSLWLVYNGEIYNFKELRHFLISKGHSFRSQGDSEIILHLYEEMGSDCVKKLDGMFAFALWDRKRKELFLSRDRSGKKPLYYYLDENVFAFSSEMKAFFKIPNIDIKIDEKNLSPFFLRGYVSSPKTLYKNIYSLEAGYSLKINSYGQKKYQRYWDISFPGQKKKISELQACQELSDIFSKAVQKRLISDVPLGAFLSGGLDSTIVISVMKKLFSLPIKTFSIGFEGDANFDETHYANEAASYVGTDHHVFRVTAQDLVSNFDNIIWHYDGPFGDSSALPTMILSSLAAKEVTVVLNGDGGDELFSGYKRMAASYYSSFIPSFIFKAGGEISRLFPQYYDHYSKWEKIHRFFKASGQNHLKSLDEWLFIFSPEELKSFFKVSNAYQQKDNLNISLNSSILDQILYMNFKDYLQNDLNVKMDRASMAFSLETRSPFLDQELIEYVCSLPDYMKLKGLTTKYILRKAFKDHMPSSIRNRGKKGFGVPIAAWFKNDLRTFVGDFLLSSNPLYEFYLDKKFVYKIVNDHFCEKQERSRQIWTLLMFERWLQKLPEWTLIKSEGY
ncbi:MAG: asparagine synthase (glutamine-hydrolyzing) [Deltaproteobacteria bacterium RIFCSPLOWO2_12_FULL_38_8]|nr:MAG: asparagine synthase (glutamine-hydrolyzing) [Deltaproteobacteria bacterium RIFCSPLOWO2_12_FULL_38_8]